MWDWLRNQFRTLVSPFVSYPKQPSYEGPTPVPVPTPYQAPEYGGSPYVTPGTTGASISAEDKPIRIEGNTIVWASGKRTPREAVKEEARRDLPTYTTPQADTRLEQLAKTDRNPIQEEEYQRLLREQAPRPTPTPTPTVLGAQAPPPTAPPPAVEEKPRELTPEEQGEGLLRNAIDQLSGLLGAEDIDETLVQSPEFQKLLQESASGAFGPYFAKTLQDYMRGAEFFTKRKREETGRLKEELGAGTQRYLQTGKSLLELAQERLGESFAERGLFESGERRRAMGLAGIEAQRGTESFLRGQERKEETAEMGLRDFLEQLSLEREQKEREIAAAKGAEVGREVEEAKRAETVKQSAKLLGQGLTPEQNLQEYFKQRAETLGKFVLPYT